VPKLSRLTAITLALAKAAVAPGLAQAAGPEPPLLPVSPTAPADSAIIAADTDPPRVKLDWSIPREPVPVRFFVEVMAIGQGKSREVFAAYVDQPPVEVALVNGAPAYAWRVYTVGRDVAAYALSGWELFSLQIPK
jgi:hypothetical protein